MAEKYPSQWASLHRISRLGVAAIALVLFSRDAAIAQSCNDLLKDVTDSRGEIVSIDAVIDEDSATPLELISKSYAAATAEKALVESEITEVRQVETVVGRVPEFICKGIKCDIRWKEIRSNAPEIFLKNVSVERFERAEESIQAQYVAANEEFLTGIDTDLSKRLETCIFERNRSEANSVISRLNEINEELHVVSAEVDVEGREILPGLVELNSTIIELVEADARAPVE